LAGSVCSSTLEPSQTVSLVDERDAEEDPEDPPLLLELLLPPAGPDVVPPQWTARTSTRLAEAVECERITER